MENRYSYVLISGGFRIIDEKTKRAVIEQPFSPVSGQPYTTEEAKKMAEYICYKLNKGQPFTITEHEEQKILTAEELTVELYDNLIEKQKIQQEIALSKSQEALLKQISDTLDLLLLEIINNKQSNI